MRPFLYLLAFVLLAGIFEGAFADREQKVIEEAHKRASEQHARIYAALAHCLNGGSLHTNDVLVTCKRKALAK